MTDATNDYDAPNDHMMSHVSGREKPVAKRPPVSWQLSAQDVRNCRWQRGWFISNEDATAASEHGFPVPAQLLQPT